MENSYTHINVKDLTENVFKLVDDDWMLITAGKDNDFNTMTASWGGFGILWHKPVSFIFIRPQRYTYEFAEKYNFYTLSFFEEKYRGALQLCGSSSGRDVNKAEQTGLTPSQTEHKNIFFREARLIMECRKLFRSDFSPEHFVDSKLIKEAYPKSDFHRMYIGEVISCMIKNNLSSK